MTAWIASSAVAIVLTAAQAGLAWIVSRRERAHRAVAIASTVLVAVGVPPLAAELVGSPVPSLEPTQAVVAAFAIWIVTRHVTGGAGRFSVGVGVLGGALAALVARSATAHGWLDEVAVLVALLGSTWSFGRVLLRRPAVEPRIAHLVVLFHVGGTAVGLVAIGGGFTDAVPTLAAATASVIAQAWWLAKVPREATDVGDRAEQRRDADRMGDVVDLAATIPERAARESSSAGSPREP